MAVKYWVSKAGGWTGPTGDGTESSPYYGALGCANAHGAGISPEDTVIFMGEYGPVLLAEIAADFANSNAITAPLTRSTNMASGQGGIIFGNRHDGASTARDITYQFRGDYPWHIDARGATTNAQRQRAALMIQGVRNTVEDLKIASADWNWLSSGRVPSSSSGTYAPDKSHENYGLFFWGGWGCKAKRVTSWGSDAFGNCSIQVALGMGITGADQVGDIVIEDCTAYGSFMNISVKHYSLIGRTTPTAPDDYIPASGANLYIRNNIVGQARWGDTATIPVINNAMYHGGHIEHLGLLWFNGTAVMYGNETYGDCQDSLQLIGANMAAYDNYIHDLNPLYPASETFQYWYNNAGTWATLTSTAIGAGIKMGLNPYDGNISKTVWPDLGTIGASTYALGAFRNRAYRNRIVNQFGSAGAIAGNSGSGCIVVANECLDTNPIQLGGSDTTFTRAHWVSNNYVRSRSGAGLQLGANAAVWAYNNILDGASTDIITPYATSIFHGGNNRLVNGTSNFNGSTNNMTANTTGAADYTEGVGPTAAGNCAASGSWQGVLGARASAALRDIDGLPWHQSRLAVGPYRGT